jgi:hypothetical protein
MTGRRALVRLTDGYGTVSDQVMSSSSGYAWLVAHGQRNGRHPHMPGSPDIAHAQHCSLPLSVGTVQPGLFRHFDETDGSSLQIEPARRCVA